MNRNRFLLDQMLDADVAVAMVEADYDVIRVSKIGLARAEDDAILARAIESSRVLITLDEHFGDWAVLPLKKHPGVIRIKANQQQPTIFCPYSCRFSLYTVAAFSTTCWSLFPVVEFGLSRQISSDRGAARSHKCLALSGMGILYKKIG